MAGRYFAEFSTRNFELKAYEKLEDKTKDGITPIVTLTRMQGVTSFQPAIEDVLATTKGREVIVDFDPIPKAVKSEQDAEESRRRKAARDRRPYKAPTEKQLAHYAALRKSTEAFNTALKKLTDRTKGGLAWMKFVETYATAVPIVQLYGEMSVLDQVAFANDHKLKIAFRPLSIHQEQVDLTRAGLAAVADPTKAILLLEAEHRRGDVEGTKRRLEGTLRRLSGALGSRFNTINKVIVSSSFPGAPLRDRPRLLEIEEIDIYAAISGGWDVAYGDHCSIQPRSEQAGGSGWFPHVDLVDKAHWLVEIDDHKSESKGFIEAAKRVVKTDHWSRRAKCWGTQMIFEASEGRVTHSDIKLTTPAPWLAVRMNQHMTRRARP